MTTKTGEALRGRKRDPEVLAKAWATRRANKAKAKRAAKRDLAELDAWKTPIRKAKKARTSRAWIGRPSKVVAQAAADEIEKLLRTEMASTTAIGASEAEGANRAVATGPNPNYRPPEYPLDDDLIAELLEFSRGLSAISYPPPGRHVILGRTTFDAVIRRLKSAF